MPNYCTNHLTVTGDEAPLAEFLAATADDNGHLRFHQLAPVTRPEGNDPTNERIIAAQVNTWGTKWDLSSTEAFTRTDAGTAIIMFDTAWSPPYEWALAASARYPTLQFTLAYDEPGSAFAGVYVLRDGQEVPGECWNGESRSWLACPYPDCDETVEGHYPWDEDYQASESSLPVYCEDHKLVEAVLRAESSSPE